MSKELEALKKVKYNSSKEVVEAFDVIEKGLQRLESIDNTNLSEAMKHFNHFEKWYDKICYHTVTSFQLDTDLSTIKQALIKTQTNEEILQKYYQEGITLDSVRVLKQERDNYKKVLNIIKEKDVDIYILEGCKTVDEYNSKIVHIVGETRELTEEEFDLLKRWLG